MSKQLRTLCILGAGLLAAVPAIAAQNANSFATRLSVVPLDVGMQINVAGEGRVTATLAGNKLTVTGNASGLKTAATTAKIQIGRAHV